jgi:ribosome-associated protein
MTENPYIELNTFLKLKNIASTGGTAKQLIRSEAIKVNGEVETRNKRKLFAGDAIEHEGEVFILQASEIQPF